jgi:hypothetical protein
MSAPAHFSPSLLEPATKILPLGNEVLEAVLAAARERGFMTIRIDLAGCTDKAALLQRIAEAMHFPDWFGHNWDAFADCLGDLSWLHAPGYVIVLDETQALRAAQPETLDVALDVFRDGAAWWADEGVPFRVFVGACSTPPPPHPR